MVVRWDEGHARRIEDAAFRGVVSGTNLVRNEILRLIMRTPKTGRVYKVRGIQRRASAPGEAPANQTRGLVGGISTRFDRPRVTGYVTSSAEYAAALEYGRLDGTIKERPHMRPGLTNMRVKIEAGIAAEIRKETQQQTRRP